MNSPSTPRLAELLKKHPQLITFWTAEENPRAYLFGQDALALAAHTQRVELFVGPGVVYGTVDRAAIQDICAEAQNSQRRFDEEFLQPLCVAGCRVPPRPTPFSVIAKVKDLEAIRLKYCGDVVPEPMDHVTII